MKFVLNSTVSLTHSVDKKIFKKKKLPLHFEEVGINDPTGHIDSTINKL